MKNITEVLTYAVDNEYRHSLHCSYASTNPKKDYLLNFSLISKKIYSSSITIPERIKKPWEKNQNK